MNHHREMKKSDFDIRHQHKSTQSKIVASLERISQAFRVLLWQECKEHALSPIQVQVLIFLLHHSEAMRKVSYLADEFNMTRATISDTVKSLELKELITKETEQTDSRSYTIHLTEKGKAIAKQNAFFTQELHVPIVELPERDREQLLLSLFKIIKHLNQTGVITIQRMCMTCMHYQNSKGANAHYCKLLNTPLKNADLRIDCPEHESIHSSIGL